MKEINKIKSQQEEVIQGLDEIIQNPENFSKEDIKAIREKLSAALDEIENAFSAKLKKDRMRKAS